MKFGPLRIVSLLVIALSAWLGWLWLDENAQLRGVTWQEPAPLRPDISAAGLGAPLGATDATNNPIAFASVIDRPIFAPDRRPPPPPAPPPPPDPMANIQIHGIFSGQVAGVLARVDGKLMRVKLNEAVGAWTLKGIEGRTVTFAQGEDSRQLRLEYSRLGPPAPKPAAGIDSPVPTGTPNAPSVERAAQNRQDEARETLRRRNEIRAAKGLPLISD